MKKINSKGFILAETLIVSVFLMSIFTMIYVNFYPLIGEYEKRENYDDVDGKYTAYWIKKLVESSGYELDTDGINMMNKFGYVRFECSDMSTENNQREMCISLVNSLEISNCDSYGNGCDAYITRYTIGDSALGTISFKNTIRTTSIKRWNEACISTSDPFAASTATTTCAANAFKECCRQKGLSSCENPVLTSSEVSYESLYSDDTKTEDKTDIN